MEIRAAEERIEEKPTDHGADCAGGITPILATIPPWGPGTVAENADPSRERYDRIDQLNHWIQSYGQQMGLVVIDYHTVLQAADGETYVPTLTVDGVHPSAAGYTLMTPLVEDAITAAQQAPFSPSQGR
jgi:lysophospholipase L1-like esterase